MKIPPDGLVEGGVEVAWIEDGSIETEVVFNPVQWVKEQFLQAKSTTWKKRFIGIGNEDIFAILEYGKRKFHVEYRHPKFLTTHGFFSVGMKQEFDDVEDAAASVILRASTVDL